MAQILHILIEVNICQYLLQLCPKKFYNFRLTGDSYHVRYLSHLALQVESSNWVHKTRIHSIQRWRHFGAKASQTTFHLEKLLHLFYYWIQYSWSGSNHILYYINLSIRWNTLLRNQISSYIFFLTDWTGIGTKISQAV